MHAFMLAGHVATVSCAITCDSDGVSAASCRRGPPATSHDSQALTLAELTVRPNPALLQRLDEAEALHSLQRQMITFSTNLYSHWANPNTRPSSSSWPKTLFQPASPLRRARMARSLQLFLDSRLQELRLKLRTSSRMKTALGNHQ